MPPAAARAWWRPRPSLAHGGAAPRPAAPQVSSKLRTKTANIAYSRVEVVPGTFAGTGSTKPGPRQLPAASRNGRPVTVSGRRALPSITSGSS